MLFKSNLIAQASGSLDGTVASHNASGRYLRNRSIPTDPGTAFQVSARAGLASAAGIWPTLGATSRAGWEVYAANVPLVNRLGDTIFISGIAHYIRSNAPRINLLGPTNRVDQPPTTYELPALSPPVYTITTASNVAAVLVAGDAWAGTGRCLIFASRPQSPSINFFKGPYLFAGSTRTPSATANITLPFPVASGNKVFFMARVTTDDGRLSTIIRGSDTF